MSVPFELRPRLFGWKGDEDGAAAVEFAIVGPIVFALMFWFFDLAFSLYVQNSFHHAVNTAARAIYLDPDRTEDEIAADLEAMLSRFGDNVTTTLTLETVGSLDYRVIDAQMAYRFKVPPFSGKAITLRAVGRAPIVNYQIDEEADG